MKNSPNVIIVDDDINIRNMLTRSLSGAGFTVQAFPQAENALDSMSRFDPDVIVSDIEMPGMGGVEFVREIKSIDPEIQVLMITGHADIETAVNVIKLGAFDYILKPLDLHKLNHMVERAAERRNLKKENRQLKHLLESDSEQTGIIGTSEPIRKIHQVIDRVADGQSTVLIEGESGTGKELIARAIHFTGSRAELPFVPVNISALPESIVESELFGHVKGAFTGADSNRPGLFAKAGSGTVFIDEIGEMSPALQVKLLRVFQEREFNPVGSDKEVKFNARIITATNKNLKALVSEESFRSDLYYRLNVISIKAPSLRERKKDIPLLVAHFAKKLARQMGISEVPRPEKSLVNALKRYHWEGNVRELENTVERMLALATGSILTLDDLPEEMHETGFIVNTLNEGGTLAVVEKKAILHALKMAKGKKRKAAEILGLGKTTLYRKIKEYGLDREY